MGILNASHIDTTPGNKGLFSPPEDFSGDEESFVRLMKQRYLDQKWSQFFHFQVEFFKKHTVNVKITGPYAKGAKRILKKLIN